MTVSPTAFCRHSLIVSVGTPTEGSNDDSLAGFLLKAEGEVQQNDSLAGG